jgi:hypothetical protein
MKHEFVEYIPNELETDTVYVSMNHATVIHSCFCGCGNQVVTPLAPTGWKLTYDGEFITLYPSVGNWNLPCKSHYWIRSGQIEWSTEWSDERIEAGRLAEASRRNDYYSRRSNMNSRDDLVLGFWARLWLQLTKIFRKK